MLSFESSATPAAPSGDWRAAGQRRDADGRPARAPADVIAPRAPGDVIAVQPQAPPPAAAAAFEHWLQTCLATRLYSDYESSALDILTTA